MYFKQLFFISYIKQTVFNILMTATTRWSWTKRTSFRETGRFYMLSVIQQLRICNSLNSDTARKLVLQKIYVIVRQTPHSNFRNFFKTLTPNEDEGISSSCSRCALWIKSNDSTEKPFKTSRITRYKQKDNDRVKHPITLISSARWVHTDLKNKSLIPATIPNYEVDCR